MMDAAAQLNRELAKTKGNPPLIGGVVLHRIIGSGGMGVVYHGTHLRLRIPVAVKFLFDRPEDKENIARFVSEATLAARLNSPYVVRVYDVNKEGVFQYIVQEFIEGETTDQQLRDAVIDGKPMSESHVLGVAADAARGLAAIHAIHYLHLDIKPVNLMVSRQDGATKILDFGLAQPFDPDSWPGSVPPRGKIACDGGTPGYASPEQLQFLTVGPSSDVYSLGVSIFEMLAGRRAFKVNTWDEACALQNEDELPDLREFRPDLGAATAELVAKCVKITPAARFQSAMELLSAIAAVSQGGKSQRMPPMAVPYNVPLGVAERPNNPNSERGPIVFCVDDDDNILDLVVDILSETSCRVEVFNDGAQILQRMRTKVPDIVFMDKEMPKMSGLQICAAMRAADNLKHIPVVFLTGDTSMHSFQTALREGATDYLFKPVQPAEVLARVQCLTRMRRAQQELSRLESEFDSFQRRLSTMSGKKSL